MADATCQEGLPGSVWPGWDQSQNAYVAALQVFWACLGRLSPEEDVRVQSFLLFRSWCLQDTTLGQCARCESQAAPGGCFHTQWLSNKFKGEKLSMRKMALESIWYP